MNKLSRSEARWQKPPFPLKKMGGGGYHPQSDALDIEEFEQRTISKETMIRLKASLVSMEADTEKLRQENGCPVQ